MFAWWVTPLERTRVALAVARDVQDVGAGERPSRDAARNRTASSTLLGAGGLEAGQRVRARAGDDPDPHGGGS